MRAAFSTHNPALKINALQSRSDEDEQKGYMEIYVGVMIGIRNPRVHEHELVDEPQIALELLVCANETLCGCLTTPLRPKHRWRLSATSRLTRPMIHLGVTPSPVYVCGAPPLPNRYSDGGGLLEALVPCGREPTAARQTPSRLPREAGRPSICCLPGLIGRCIISPPLATPQDVISPSCGKVHGTVAMCAIILGRGSIPPMGTSITTGPLHSREPEERSQIHGVVCPHASRAECRRTLTRFGLTSRFP